MCFGFAKLVFGTVTKPGNNAQLCMYARYSLFIRTRSAISGSEEDNLYQSRISGASNPQLNPPRVKVVCTRPFGQSNGRLSAPSSQDVSIGTTVVLLTSPGRKTA